MAERWFRSNPARVAPALLAALVGCGSHAPTTPPGGLWPDLVCDDASLDEPDPDGGRVDPVDAGGAFVPLGVPAAVAKVKNLLVGLPPTDAEVAAVVADEGALPGLVAGWMTLPQYADKMLAFFVTTFQQDQWVASDLTFQFRGDFPFSGHDKDHGQGPATHEARAIQNLQQGFARTVMKLVDDGEPFTKAMTTTRFMMTPALMAAYATLDEIAVDDRYNLIDRFQQDHPTTVTLESATPVPIEQVVAAGGSGALTLYDPAIAAQYDPSCPFGTIVYPSPAPFGAVANLLFSGAPFPFMPMQCRPPTAPDAAQYLQSADFSTWQMVTVRPPAAGEPTTMLYDLPSMRAGHDLVLDTPRVGFFTTPAFAARWPTNDSNLARVLINQTMIVALGQPIDLTNTTPPQSLEALDQAHAAPGSTCYKCHQSLDPMRQFFRQSYSLYFSKQYDATVAAVPGQFAFHGASVAGTSILDLGAQLAAHPMFAAAWVQKLCTYATSQRCDESDPEFVRLVGVFTGSNYGWNALVKALFASPLVTYRKETATATGAGQAFPIARQGHLCATLSARLGVADLCGLDVNSGVGSDDVVKKVSSSWPSDQYSRGNPLPSLAGDPSLLTRGGMESLCAALADRFVDAGPASGYLSSDPDAAVHKLTTTLMGLTSDRAAEPLELLQCHYKAALASPASPGDALKSTFVLACLSPYVAGIGQ
jgi:hypothetical protein